MENDDDDHDDDDHDDHDGDDNDGNDDVVMVLVRYVCSTADGCQFFKSLVFQHVITFAIKILESSHS